MLGMFVDPTNCKLYYLSDNSVKKYFKTIKVALAKLTPTWHLLA